MTAAARGLPRAGGHQVVDARSCHGCGHPARTHNAVGCVHSVCECMVTRAEIDGPPVEAAHWSPPSAAVIALLDVRCWCGHVRTEHGAKGSSVCCRVCPCTSFTDGGSDAASVAAPSPASEPAGPPVEVAPAAAAEAGAGGEQAAQQPVAVPPWLPGAGVARVKRPALLVEVTTPDEDVVRQIDEIIAAGKVAAKRRPRSDADVERAADEILAAAARQPLAVVEAPRRTTPRTAGTALAGLAVDSEADAVEVPVASTSAAVTLVTPVDVRWGQLPPEVTATPGPPDITPVLGAALHHYAAWACTVHVQRRHDPGPCPECDRPLVSVHVIVYPRSLA